MIYVSKGILYVDDNSFLRFMWRRLFETWGFQVTEAASPDEALWAMRKGLPSDLVLSDVSFPNVEPRRFADFLSECLHSDRPLLIYTGAVWESPPDLGDIMVLQKMCSQEEMLLAVSMAWEAKKPLPDERSLLLLASPTHHTSTPIEKQEALLLSALDRNAPASKQALSDHDASKGLRKDLDQMAGKEWPKKELEERYDMFLASQRRLELLCGKKHPCVLQRRTGLRGGG